MPGNTPKHVLCAIEPNEESRETVQIAALFAKRSGGDLTLMHVVPPMWQPYPDLNFTPVAETQATLEEDMVNAATEHLNNLAGDVDANCRDILVRRGQPAHLIAEQADSVADTLIVMGVHNRRGLRRLLGSTAHAVLNASEAPILLTHADDERNIDYKTILIAVDTSEAMEDVLAHARPFIDTADQVKVVTVVPSLAATMGSLHGSAFSTAWPLTDMQGEMVNASRDSVTAGAAKFGLQADQVAVIEGDPANEICREAEAIKADVIIIGSGKRGILDRVLLGSTAHAVLNNTPCDIYIARG